MRSPLLWGDVGDRTRCAMKKTVPGSWSLRAVALGAIVTIPAEASDIADSCQTVYANRRRGGEPRRHAVAGDGTSRSPASPGPSPTRRTGDGPANSDDAAWRRGGERLGGVGVTGTDFRVTAVGQLVGLRLRQACRRTDCARALVTGNGTYAARRLAPRTTAEVNWRRPHGVVFDDWRRLATAATSVRAVRRERLERHHRARRRRVERLVARHQLADTFGV